MQEETNFNEASQPNDPVQRYEQANASSPAESAPPSAQRRLPSKKTIVVIVICLIVAGTFFFATTPITESQKDERIARAYLEEGYDAAMELVRRYYGDSDDAVSWALFFSRQEEDSIKDLVTITDQDVSVTSSGNYFDYRATVRNDSDATLSYIEITIYLLDDDKNIIYSDWTNWSGTLPPGASTTLDTMIDHIDNVHYFRVSVEDISTK